MPYTHARFSPSAANRRIHCPPSLLLEEQFEEGESVYAAEGTAGHALAEYLIRKHLKQRTTRPTSEYYKDELLEAVDEYVSFVIGEIEDANGVGEVGNAKCGDIMKIYLKVSDDGIIEDVKFKTFGCGAAIATSSMATEMVKGKSLEEALKLTNKAVAEALDGLPPVKMHCSVLAEEALRSAISDYYKRLGKDPAEILGCDADCETCHKAD